MPFVAQSLHGELGPVLDLRPLSRPEAWREDFRDNGIGNFRRCFCGADRAETAWKLLENESIGASALAKALDCFATRLGLAHERLFLEIPRSLNLNASEIVKQA
jgi:hypothetical protein